MSGRQVDRASYAELTQLFLHGLPGASADDVWAAARDLHAFAQLLAREPQVRRALSSPAIPLEARASLFQELVGSRLTPRGRETAEALVRLRWRSAVSLLDAAEVAAMGLFLRHAFERDALARVEDELFRFWRMLEANPRLVDMLEDETAPAELRVRLVADLVGGKAHPATTELLGMLPDRPLGYGPAFACQRMVEMASRIIDHSVAYVTSTLPLSDDETERLAAELERIVGRPVDVKVTVDPKILGGLVVRIDNEIIDGSVARRLREVRAHLTASR